MGSACNNTLEPLFLLQKKSVRLVNNSNFLDHTAPILKSLKILTLSQIFNNNCLIFIYKCIKENKFPSIIERILRKSDIHQHNTRNNDQYRLPTGRLRIFRKAYFVQGLTLWISIDIDIKNCNNIGNFKMKIKNKCFD